MPARWTAFVIRHRLAVVAVWIIVAALGIWAAASLHGRLETSFTVPGSESARADAILEHHFGVRPEGTFTVVFPVAHPSDRVLRARLQRRLDQAARSVPTGHATTLQEGGRILFGDVSTTLDLQRAKARTTDLRRALRTPGGPSALVTGAPAVQHDLDPVLASDLRRGEALALPIALIVLVAVLGLSLAVAIPFAVAAGAITATLGAVFVFAAVTPVVAFVPNLVELIGLGLAIDYSLLVVSRFREELARGRPPDDAVTQAMATAGRAVVFSGLAVAIGLGLLLLMPIPFIRGLGLGGFLVPLAAIAAGVSLQPALLSLLGARAGSRAEPGEDGVWSRIARAIMRRPVLNLTGGTAVLCAAAVPALFLQLTPGSVSGLPSSPEAVQGYTLLRDRAGPGLITPTQIVVDAGAPGAARSGPVRAAIGRLTRDLAADGEAYVIASGRKPPYVDSSGRYARVVVAGRHEYGDRATQSFVHRLRDRILPAAAFPAGTRYVPAGSRRKGSTS